MYLVYVKAIASCRKFYLSHRLGHGDWYLPSFFCTDSETNNTAMSLTSIQKKINSLPTNMDLHLRPHTSGVLIFRVCILHVFMHEALAEINKIVTRTSHVFAMKRLQHTA